MIKMKDVDEESDAEAASEDVLSEPNINKKITSILTMINIYRFNCGSFEYLLTCFYFSFHCTSFTLFINFQVHLVIKMNSSWKHNTHLFTFSCLSFVFFLSSFLVSFCQFFPFDSLPICSAIIAVEMQTQSETQKRL